MLRPAALGLAGLACCLGVTGCAQFNKALGQQQATIYFQSSTPVAFTCGRLLHAARTFSLKLTGVLDWK